MKEKIVKWALKLLILVSVLVLLNITGEFNIFSWVFGAITMAVMTMIDLWC